MSKKAPRGLRAGNESHCSLLGRARLTENYGKFSGEKVNMAAWR